MAEKKLTALQAHRARCIECCCGDTDAIRDCNPVGEGCASWPFRFGKNPEIGAKRRESARAGMIKYNALKKTPLAQNLRGKG